MNDMARTAEDRYPGPADRAPSATRIPLGPLGMSLGAFLAITFALCVAFDLQFPDYAMHDSWHRLLPGFTWLTWPGFLLGLVQSFPYGWYIAPVFVPLHNFFAKRSRR